MLKQILLILFLIIITISSLLIGHTPTTILIYAFNVENSGVSNNDIKRTLKYAENFFISNNLNIEFIIKIKTIDLETLNGFKIENIDIRSPEYLEEAKANPKGITADGEVVSLFSNEGGPINIIFVNYINDMVGVADENINTIGISNEKIDEVFMYKILLHEISHQFGLIDTTHIYYDTKNLMWDREISREGIELREEQIIQTKKHIAEEWR